MNDYNTYLSRLCQDLGLPVPLPPVVDEELSGAEPVRIVQEVVPPSGEGQPISWAELEAGRLCGCPDCLGMPPEQRWSNSPPRIVRILPVPTQQFAIRPFEAGHRAQEDDDLPEGWVHSGATHCTHAATQAAVWRSFEGVWVYQHYLPPGATVVPDGTSATRFAAMWNALFLPRKDALPPPPYHIEGCDCGVCIECRYRT